MAVTTDIVETWRGPRSVVRRLLARGTSEPFAFSLLLTFLLLALVALTPNLERQAYFDAGASVLPRLYASGLGLLTTIPFWYLLAAIAHIGAGWFGGRGSYFGARLALFWTLVAISPAMLVQGMVLGVLGNGLLAAALGWAVALGFLALWIVMLREVEKG